MATRYLGLGTVLSVDHDADASYADGVIALIINGSPPTREREEVDDTTLEDILQTYTPGIEKHSKYSFKIKWDSADAIHIALLTLFDAKTKVNWRIVFTSATSNTWTFQGWVQQLNIQSIEHNKHYEGDVVVNRTGAITIT
jgi:hypothetical protein